MITKITVIITFIYMARLKRRYFTKNKKESTYRKVQKTNVQYKNEH